MTFYATNPDLSPRMDDEEDEETIALRQPVVDSKSTEDRTNPPTEYDVMELGDLEPDALKKKLNELGDEGWALVSTSPYFIFRRMKKQEEKKAKARVGFGVG